MEPLKRRKGVSNLLVGDETGLHYLSNRSNATHRSLAPGIYGLSNALLDTPWPKLLNVRNGLTQQLQDNHLKPDTLISLMMDQTQAADTDLPDTGISAEWEKMLSSCFIRSTDYGTRAITLILQKPDGTTYLREDTFDTHGNTDSQEFELQLPAIGAAARINQE